MQKQKKTFCKFELANHIKRVYWKPEICKKCKQKLTEKKHICPPKIECTKCKKKIRSHSGAQYSHERALQIQKQNGDKHTIS